MADAVTFSFSDTIAGYVTRFDSGTRLLRLKTADGREFDVSLAGDPSAELVRNLDEPYIDASGHIDEMLSPGRFLFVYGVHYPERGGGFDAKRLVFLGRGAEDYRFEEPSWWIKQIESLADFYKRAQFGDGPVDFTEYRTEIRLGGDKTASHVQETDTISRLVYGMASAYLLTGKDEYLEVAERGTEYLRKHMRVVDSEEDVVFWYHGISVDGDSERKLFTSEFSDDYDAIPMYEQIYALAGPIQTYRVTGDIRIKNDADATIRLFDKFFFDPEQGGYYSHIDPILFSADHESLGENAERKNWNSVGDHAPAYLINLYLATGDQKYADFLEYTFDTIADKFPDYKNSPFVQERFFRDWSHDTAHSWATEPRGGRPQPEDRLEPDADELAEGQAGVRAARQEDRRDHAGGRQRRAARRLVRRRRAAQGRRPGGVPVRLARPQGLVAAGAGDPRLPHPERHGRRRREPA
ncbi:hypothetical protein ACVWXB_006401 [Streptomyces sp. TE12347]